MKPLLAAVLAALLVTIAHASSNTGPALSLSQLGANSIRLNAAASPSFYTSFSSRIHLQSTSGLSHVAVTAAGVREFAKVNSFCPPLIQDGRDYVFACVNLGDPGDTRIKSAGTLAAFTFTATGNGCLDVSLVADTSPLGTYTADVADPQPNVDTAVYQQQNQVSSTPVRLVFGTGCQQAPAQHASGGGTMIVSAPRVEPAFH